MPRGFVWGVGGAAWQEEGIKPGVGGLWTDAIFTDRFRSKMEGAENVPGGDPELKKLGCRGEILYPSDYKLIAGLGLTMRRISIAREKIEPERGRYDYEELDRLKDMVDTGLHCGVATRLTLDHWEHAPGCEWNRDDAPDLFGNVTEAVMKKLGTSVKYVDPLNEPTVISIFGYGAGIWPPFIADRARMMKVLRNRIEAHCIAYDIIKRYNPLAEVGIAHAVGWWTGTPPTDPAEKEDRYVWGRFVTDELVKRGKLDNVGLNNYHHNEVGKLGWAGHDACTDHPVVSDFNWGMCTSAPAGVAREYWKAYKLPIWMTEVGHADHHIVDHRRSWHLFHYVRELAQAAADGVDLRGNITWSFMDNTEWMRLYTQKFGIFAVNMNDPRRPRKLRASGRLLSAIANANGATEEVGERFRDLVCHPHLHSV